MTPNKITKLGLEARTADLKKQGKSEREISIILTTETKQKITGSCVHRYLAANTKLIQQVVESNDKLKVKVANNTLDVIAESLMQISVIKHSIQDARDRGVSPDKLSGLFNNWIRALELSSELLGDINRAPVLNLQINAEFNELKAVIIGELCPACKAKVKGRLYEIAGN